VYLGKQLWMCVPTNEIQKLMKTIHLIKTSVLLAALLVSAGPVILGQDSSTGKTAPARSAGSDSRSASVAEPGQERKSQPRNSDLSFPGGTPAELIEAIRQQMNEHVNVAIPPELAHTQLPPLNMRNVNVYQLLEAITQSSRRTVTYKAGMANERPIIERFQTAFGFRRTDLPGHEVWFFFKDEPSIPDFTVCRYFHLGAYLDIYKIEDITTAIRSGWKLLREAHESTLNKRLARSAEIPSP